MISGASKAQQQTSTAVQLNSFFAPVTAKCFSRLGSIPRVPIVAPDFFEAVVEYDTSEREMRNFVAAKCKKD